MEPVISPWLIYGLFLIDSIGKSINAFCGISLILMFGSGVIYSIIKYNNHPPYKELDENSDRYARDRWRDYQSGVEGAQLCLKIFKISVVVFGICFPLDILIPPKEDCYKIVAANYVTVDSVNTVLRKGGDFKDVLKKDIIDVIMAVKEEVDKE